MFSLAGRAAVVTGAGSGIGKAIARALAGAGASVLAADIDEAKANAAASELKAEGGKAEGCRVDVRSRLSVDSMIGQSLKRFGRIDVSVHAAGIGGRVVPFMDMTETDWGEVIDSNLKSLFLCGQAAAREMIKAGGGSIINITSQVGDVAQRHCAPYVASKGGGKMLTKAMALDLAQHGVRVNAIAPGLTKTGMTNLEGDNWQIARQDILQHIPMGRPAVPAEMGGAAVFLASDAASYVTGSTVYVDGGYLTM